MDKENPGKKLFAPEDAAKFFSSDLLDKETVLLWIMSQLHPSGGLCPECSVNISDERQAKLFKFEQIRCPACGRKFTAATGTLLHGAKLDPEEIFLLAVLSHLTVPAARIAGVLHCHVDTVTNWQAHFKAQQELASA